VAFLENAFGRLSNRNRKMSNNLASSSYAAASVAALPGEASEMLAGITTGTSTGDSMAYLTVIGKEPEKCILPRIVWDQIDIKIPTTLSSLYSALYMTGVAAFSNLISVADVDILAVEARALIDRSDVGNIDFEGGAPTAWRRQCKLMAGEAQVVAPETYGWANSLLRKLQQHAASLCTPAHKVEYIAIIENLTGRQTTAQLLHADRGLTGSSADPESYSLVVHLPLTSEGQRLSMLLGSHNNLPLGSGRKAYVCHNTTELTEGLIHFANLIHAASAEPEGLARLRLVINLSAKQPPPGPEHVQLHLVDGKYATAQPVTVAAAHAWKYGTDTIVGSKKTKRRHQGSVMRGGAKKPPEKRRPRSRPRRGDVSGAACSTRSGSIAEDGTSGYSDMEHGDSERGKMPIPPLVFTWTLVRFE
jgi:hypothetical protein